MSNDLLPISLLTFSEYVKLLNDCVYKDDLSMIDSQMMQKETSKHSALSDKSINWKRWTDIMATKFFSPETDLFVKKRMMILGLFFCAEVDKAGESYDLLVKDKKLTYTELQEFL